MTLTQKILADHAVGLTRPWVEAGDILRIRVDWTIASELAWNGMDRTYQLLGRPPLHDKDRFFLAVDHTVDPDTLAHDARTQRLVQLSQSFAKESGIRHFYDANQTILHTKFYRDLVQPGEVVLGADSHTSSHGGMGAFSIGLGGADVTAAMVLGETWIEVPEAIAVEYRGTLPFGLGGKDVILRTLGQLRRNTVAMERSVEYCGPAVKDFSTDVRFTIANMTAEFGGLNGIFEADGVVQAWLDQRRDHKDRPRYFRADPDAPYATRHRIDLDDLEPQVARPFSPDNAGNVTSAVGTRLDGAFIGACTTTEEELVLGALVLEQSLKYREAVPSEKRLVVPGSLEIQERLRERGLWRFYEKGGFKIDPPGCSMCLGIASRKAGKGELWLSSQNRNFENRMGAGSLAWLASAATVAASSVGMEIIDPRPLLAMVDQDRYLELLGRKGPSRVPELEAAEPAPALKPAASGAAAGHGPDSSALVRAPLQRFEDNVDTDAIIPGEFCHLTDLKELGQKAFRHVRPAFYQRAFCGMQVVVAGEGWGSGSSREQAVWALKGAGIKVIIARSFAFIHKRNLVNEGLPYLVVTDPDFYELAREGEELEVDLAAGAVRHVASGKTFSALSPSPIVQALRHEGGLVDAIKHHGPKVFEALAASTQ
jgi:aconitate hydratase/homoaconitate hydratase